jgi:hypothetical protein
LFSASLPPPPPQRLMQELRFLPMCNTYWLAMAPGGPVPRVAGRSPNFFAKFYHHRDRCLGSATQRRHNIQFYLS